MYSQCSTSSATSWGKTDLILSNFFDRLGYSVEKVEKVVMVKETAGDST
jgi:hypothetical protein